MSVDLEEPTILSAAGIGLLHNDTLHASQKQPDDRPNATNNANDTAASTADTSKNDQFRPKLYKFYVSRFVDIVRIRFAITSACNQCAPITIGVQANAIPTASDFVHSMTVVTNRTSDTVANFYPQQNAWHYMEIGFPADDALPSASAKPTASDAAANQPQIIDEHVDFGVGLEFVNETVVDAAKSSPNKSDGVERPKKADGSSADSKTAKVPGVAQAKTTPTAPTTSATTTGTSQTDAPAPAKGSNDPASAAAAAAAAVGKQKRAAKTRNINYYSLSRQTYREFFMFDYDLLPDDSGIIPTFINLTAGTTTGFRFNIGNVYDIGGTMSFALAMKDNLQDAALDALESAAMRSKANRISSDMAVAEKLVQSNSDEELAPQNSKMESLSFGMNRINGNIDDIDNNTSRSNQTIIVCMRLGQPGRHNLYFPGGRSARTARRVVSSRKLWTFFVLFTELGIIFYCMVSAIGIPTWPDKCVYGNNVFPAASIVNNTNNVTSTGVIHVPFPEPGNWYVTLGTYGI